MKHSAVRLTCANDSLHAIPSVAWTDHDTTSIKSNRHVAQWHTQRLLSLRVRKLQWFRTDLFLLVLSVMLVIVTKTTVTAFLVVSPSSQPSCRRPDAPRSSFSLTTRTTTTVNPFISAMQRQRRYRTTATTTTTTSTTTTTTALGSSSTPLPAIPKMKPGDMRQELESYGISTKSFLEKSELIDALEKARSEGRQPVNNNNINNNNNEEQNSSPPKQAKQQEKTNRSTAKTSSSSSSTDSRAERIQQEMEKAKEMKVNELRQELQDRGISSKSFFEKSEFIKAYAESVVDGVTKKSGGERGAKGSNRSSSGSNPKSRASTQEANNYDPTYRDVVMMKMDPRDPRLLQGTVIDVKLAR